mmetsp:Transcript_27935/g.83526  ORF Transcript_27935/g.83526 Transcript_27935/m.83526 type:complete len:200 (+) Transcript_27935:1148-1747(+)
MLRCCPPLPRAHPPLRPGTPTAAPLASSRSLAAETPPLRPNRPPAVEVGNGVLWRPCAPRPRAETWPARRTRPLARPGPAPPRKVRSQGPHLLWPSRCTVKPGQRQGGSGTEGSGADRTASWPWAASGAPPPLWSTPWQTSWRTAPSRRGSCGCDAGSRSSRAARSLLPPVLLALRRLHKCLKTRPSTRPAPPRRSPEA